MEVRLTNPEVDSQREKDFEEGEVFGNLTDTYTQKRIVQYTCTVMVHEGMFSVHLFCQNSKTRSYGGIDSPWIASHYRDLVYFILVSEG